MNGHGTRARLALGAGLVGLALVGAACGGSDDEGDGGDAGAGATVAVQEIAGDITLSGWASSPTETKLLTQSIADFQKKFPKVKVNYQPISGDYPAAMTAKFSARKPPDVFYVDSNYFPDWQSQQLLEPLDGYVEKNAFDTKAFFPNLLEGFKGDDGKIYGFPKDWSPLATFTADEALTKAGVEPPTTWDELTAAAEKLKPTMKKGARPICLSPGWDRMLAFVYQNGGTFLSEDGKSSAVNTPEAKEAADFYTGLIKDGLAGLPTQLGSGWCGEAIGKGNAAIAFEGNWLVPFMKDTFPKVKYAISPMIKGKQEGNLAFTVSYSMAADSKQKDAAWVLLSYLTGPEGMKTWTSQGLALPSRSDVEPVAGREAFIGAAEAARPWQFAPKFSKVVDTANNSLTGVIEGKSTTDEMLKKVDAAAADALG